MTYERPEHAAERAPREYREDDVGPACSTGRAFDEERARERESHDDASEERRERAWERHPAVRTRRDRFPSRDETRLGTR